MTIDKRRAHQMEVFSILTHKFKRREMNERQIWDRSKDATTKSDIAQAIEDLREADLIIRASFNPLGYGGDTYVVDPAVWRFQQLMIAEGQQMLQGLMSVLPEGREQEQEVPSE